MAHDCLPPPAADSRDRRALGRPPVLKAANFIKTLLLHKQIYIYIYMYVCIHPDAPES